MAIKDSRGQLIAEPTAKAELWAESFAKQAEDSTGRSKDDEPWKRYLDDRVLEMIDRWAEEGRTGQSAFKMSKVLDYVNILITDEHVDYEDRPYERQSDAWNEQRTIEEQAEELWARRVVLDAALKDDITIEDITDFLKEAGRNKSPGLDGLTNEWLMIATSEGLEGNGMAKCLKNLIEYAWINAKVYEDWTTLLDAPISVLQTCSFRSLFTRLHVELMYMSFVLWHSLTFTLFLPFG